MPVSNDQIEKIREQVLEGSYGFLSETQLAKKKSMFVNVHFGGKEKLLFAILCSLYGISYATERGVNLFNARGKVRKNMIFRLRNPKTWKNYFKGIQIVNTDLLIDFTYESLEQFEQENEIALHLLFKDPTRNGESGYVTSIRTPGYNAWNYNQHAYIYVLQRNEVDVTHQKYFGANYDFVSVLDYNRFICSSPIGCDYCEHEEQKEPLENKIVKGKSQFEAEESMDCISLAASMDSLLF